MATFTYTKPTVGGSEDTWGTTLNANWDALGTFLGSLDSAELAVLDGITSTTAELNLLDGVTVTLADITSTAAELNLLDGVTATTAEINYLDGVTSAIQTQLDAKAPDNELTQVEVEDDTSTVFGQVSGERLAQAVAVQAVGVGQTWQVVTRSSGTAYQNTTGKPIAVSIVTTSTFSGSTLSVGPTAGTTIKVSEFGSGNQLRISTCYAVIPNGHYYIYSGPINTWTELR